MIDFKAYKFRGKKIKMVTMKKDSVKYCVLWISALSCSFCFLLMFLEFMGA